MNWEQMLLKLQSDVPAGHVTTYKEVALWAFGKPTGTQAVVAMLKGAVNSDSANSQFTNRVISESGKLANPNGQSAQLFNEGVPMEGGIVNMRRARVVRFSN